MRLTVKPPVEVGWIYNRRFVVMEIDPEAGVNPIFDSDVAVVALAMCRPEPSMRFVIDRLDGKMLTLDEGGAA